MTETLPLYQEVVIDTPKTITPAVIATAEPLFRQPYKWVTSISIRVRSMGTATYFGIGNNTAQEFRLVGVGQIWQFSCNPGEVIDAAQIWVISDTAGGVLEIVASYLPVSHYGNVNMAIGQR